MLEIDPLDRRKRRRLKRTFYGSCGRNHVVMGETEAWRSLISTVDTDKQQPEEEKDTSLKLSQKDNV
ncbi:hypothetical protein E2C01_064494 [Portunus trituberculatus]|uniref:Uncharacterized protein n=1 Tax=Portunus trituberculatus TaxID=210409 RepID=A0A5B7HGA6_PORTR|nr:hypothetical protein [Portunus trituberculatus]